MMRAIFRDADDRPVIVLGIDAVNIVRLVRGQPIEVDVGELVEMLQAGGAHLNDVRATPLERVCVLLLAGETAEEMQAEVLAWAGAKPQ